VTTPQALTATDTTITATDEIYFGDVTDFSNIKKDTVQGIIDLVPAADLSGQLHLNQTVAQTFTGGTVTGSGLLKVTSGLLGLDTNTYLTSVTAHNLLSATHGDTLAGSPVLGDVMIGNATPKWDKTAGNITTTKKYLQSVGNGAISAVPTFQQIAYADVSGTPTIPTQYWGRAGTVLSPATAGDSITSTATITGEQITSTDDITANGTIANTMGATDQTGIAIDGATNPLTTSIAVTQALYINRLVNISAPDTNLTVRGSFINVTNSSVAGGGTNKVYYNNLTESTFNVTGNHNQVINFPGSTLTEYNVGNLVLMNRTGTISAYSTRGIPIEITNSGIGFQLTDSVSYNNASGTLNSANYGGSFTINSSGAQTAGTLNKTNYGVYSSVYNTAGGTSTGYGYYISTVSGHTTNWGFYNDTTAGHNFLGKDNVISYIGTGRDVGYYYDGTNTILKNYVGTGFLDLQMNLQLSAKNIITDTTTGMKIGTATNQKLGFFNATPIVQPSAYTQTYSTASKTNPNVTTTAVDTTASTQVTPYGYSTSAQADAIPTQINALQADLLATKKLLNALIDDLQSLGLAS